MLIDLILGLLLIGGVTVGVRWWRARDQQAPGPAELGPPSTSVDNPLMQEALDLRQRVHEALARHAGAVNEADSAREEIDQILHQLADQLDVKTRIERVLAELDATTIANDVADAELRAEAANDDENRRVAGVTLERLQTQRDQLERLERRRNLLDGTTRQTVVDLRNLQLALLDALSTHAGLRSDQLQTARQNLARTSETLRQQASADEEISALLANARQGERIGQS